MVRRIWGNRRSQEQHRRQAQIDSDAEFARNLQDEEFNRAGARLNDKGGVSFDKTNNAMFQRAANHYKNSDYLNGFIESKKTGVNANGRAIHNVLNKNARDLGHSIHETVALQKSVLAQYEQQNAARRAASIRTPSPDGSGIRARRSPSPAHSERSFPRSPSPTYSERSGSRSPSPTPSELLRRSESRSPSPTSRFVSRPGSAFGTPPGINRGVSFSDRQALRTPTSSPVPFTRSQSYNGRGTLQSPIVVPIARRPSPSFRPASPSGRSSLQSPLPKSALARYATTGRRGSFDGYQSGYESDSSVGSSYGR